VSAALTAVLTVTSTAAGLASTLASLVAQSDPRWQWCVAISADAPAGTVAETRVLIASEPRATLAAGPNDRAALAALALSLADADAVAWVDPGDRLDPGALAAVSTHRPPATWLYTDEAASGDDGLPVDVWYKPDFSPERLRSQPYALRLAVLPLPAVRDLGGINQDAGSAAWYDLVLRLADRLDPPVHLAGPYYLHGERSQGGPFVVEDPVDRCRVVAWSVAAAGARVSPIDVGGRPVGQRVRRDLPRHPKISLIIPTRASSSMIHGFPRCHAIEFIRSLWVVDRYPDLEVVVVYDTGTPAEALREISDITKGEAVLVPFRGVFHFSRKCNLGALAATGEYVCFLNDDMEVITPDWLSEMASLLDDPTVGAIGARLLFADGTLQHAGHEYNGGQPGHTMFRFAPDDPDQGGAALVTSERSGVTGACMLMRARDFLAVGGFSDQFPLSYNDVDLSLKIRAKGLRILYTPHASLFHYESQTREATVTADEMTRIRLRWFEQLHADPYVNELLRSPIAE